jgi:hypothetical protein
MAIRKFGGSQLVISLAIMVVLFSCRSKSDNDKAVRGEAHWTQQDAEIEYELIQAELHLAKAEKPYLVLNAKNNEIEIRLKGAVVWNYPLELAGDEGGRISDFIKHFSDETYKYIRPVTEKHLFAFSNKTPDSILAIIAPAVGVNPELMQREVPERFQLLWGRNLILEVRTDVAGKPISKFKNTIADFRRAIQAPFGESYLVIKMDPEKALTLYRLTEPGLPTLLYPDFREVADAPIPRSKSK